MIRTRRWFRALTALTAGAAMTVAGITPATASGASEAVAVTTATTAPYVCQTRISGVWTPVPGYSRGFSVTAPDQVAPGSKVRISFDPDPILAVALFNKEVRLVTVTYRLPAGAQLLAYSLSGGSGLGTSRQVVSPMGDEIQVLASGPFYGGTAFDLPTLTVILKAPQSGVLTTGPGGDSFLDPGFGWWREQTNTLEWDPFQCYPDPAQPVVFSTTTIV